MPADVPAETRMKNQKQVKPMKRRYSSLRRDVNRPQAKAQIFLGQKVLGELRILIRLAASLPPNGQSGSDHSF
jgi:hypothetical protein